MDKPNKTKPINKTIILIILLGAIALIGIIGIYQLTTIKQTLSQLTISTNDIGIKLNGEDLNKQAIIVIPANIK